MLSPYSINEHSQSHKILYFYLLVVSIVFSLENTILEVCYTIKKDFIQLMLTKYQVCIRYSAQC